MTKTEKIVDRRHPEWSEHQIRWRWLLDSYEGGQVYRNAVYGWDTRGLPVRNLIRHKREYPDPRETGTSQNGYRGDYATSGQDPAVASTDDDYEMRRARTPVPDFVSEAIGTHLGKIYAQEIAREIPETGYDDLREWFRDADGEGRSFEEWVRERIAPLLLVHGQIDVQFDHPKAPADEPVRSRADVKRLGLDKCVANIILPDNMVWWKTDARRRYVECLVKEHDEDECRYRHWTAQGWTLFNENGDVEGRGEHAFGVVPITRFIDKQRPRCRNVGFSRYESIAERQREYYNRDSELILSDTTQAHPLLQGPEDFIHADGTIPIGPSWLLPKKKNSTGTATNYEGFDVIEFPKDGAESIRKNKAEIRDDVDRSAGLTKPAGAAGTGRTTVSQSGVSKQMDAETGNNLLSWIASTLAGCEHVLIRYALAVLRDDASQIDADHEIEIRYPKQFALHSAVELADGLAKLQDAAESAGNLPEAEIAMLCGLIRKLNPGLSDKQYEEIDKEVREHVERKSDEIRIRAESPSMLPPVPGSSPFPQEDLEPDESESEADAESDDDSDLPY